MRFVSDMEKTDNPSPWEDKVRQYGVLGAKPVTRGIIFIC